MRSDVSEEGPEVPARVWTGTLLLFGARAVGSLTALASFALLARGLGAPTFGRLTFYLALLALVQPMIDCGTSTAALQLGSHDPLLLARAIRDGRRLRLLAALAASLIVTVVSLSFGAQETPWVLASVLLSATRALEISALVYHARIAWSVPARVRTAVAFLRLALVLSLLGLGVSTFGPFLFAYSLAGALGNIALHLLAQRHLLGVSALDPRGSPLLRAALPLALIGVLQQAYFYVDNLVLRSVEGDASLGPYNAAMRIFSLLVLLAALSTNTALPWLARRSQGGQLGASTLRLTLRLFPGAALCVGLLWPFADPLLTHLFGPGFSTATPSLHWLLGAALCVYAGAPALTGLLAEGRSRTVLLITSVALAFNLIGNLLLVPELGIEGAAVSTFATELFVSVASIALLASPTRPGTRPAARP